MPRYAFGATPERVRTAPRIFACIRSPGAIPATCVAWNDRPASYGFVSFGERAIAGDSRGGGNARATITFGVVKAVCPFGNPAGYE